jgi:hypothetical protein
MKGIKFNKELGLLDMVLSGQKTSFRVVAKKRASDKILSSTKFKVNDRLAILQTYKDLNINPDEQLHVVENKVNIIKAAKDTKGWNLVSSVDPALMPHVIEITDVKTENIQDI